ncbi:MAG: EAL domain-containing response regulator [Stenotrophomonas sp.]|uniref:EAL domain-containing response regulator n=1 Tax=Stenotrophomonas sp. TaxID=69392 RepID=UPI003D6CF6D8
MPNRLVLILDEYLSQSVPVAALFTAAGRTRVDVCVDGNEARELCLAHVYDLVVTDPMMREVDGIQFIQSLAGNEHKPALVLTSAAPQRMLASVRLMAESLGLRVLAVVPKPVAPGDVADLLELLDSHAADSVGTDAGRGPMLRISRECLADAISSHQITPWFQPKVSLASGLVVAAEALVRWVHPVLGVVSPARFLPLVEAHALEPALLRHVLRASIGAQRQWRMAGFRVPVSINLPTHLLERSSLPDELLELTLQEGGRVEDVCFELMECSTTRHVSDYYAGACRLRMKGFGLAQDDFGQGISSVYNLVSTPFTEVKIDRALVQDCSRRLALRAVLSTIISLGNTLGINVVAEGVETDEEFTTLERLGCTQAQGFLISAAVPWESFAALLGKEKPRAWEAVGVTHGLVAV